MMLLLTGLVTNIYSSRSMIFEGIINNFFILVISFSMYASAILFENSVINVLTHSSLNYSDIFATTM